MTTVRCAAPGRRPRRGSAPWVIATVVLAAACGGEREEAAREYAAVEVLVVQPVRFEAELTTTGTIDLPDDATLAAEVGGIVAMIVGEGATVGAGQVVAQLDPRAERAGVASAQAAVLEARAVAEQTEDAYRRQAPLAADTIISPLELERLQAERAQAHARAQQAEAQLREAQDRLEQTRLRAPFAGTVERVLVRRGEQVGPGTELLRIVRPGRAEIEAGVPERYAGQVQVGSSAAVDLAAYGIGMRAAPVSVVGSAIDPRSRTFPVRIEVPNPTGAIKADMVARVSIVWLVLPAAIVVPLEAVERDEQGESVLVAAVGTGAYFAQRRRVVTGPRSDVGVVIEAGLIAGDEVIVTGREEVANGEPVEVTRRYPNLDAWRAELGHKPAP
jgi:membrane fusion protein, multidrug efflux system